MKRIRLVIILIIAVAGISSGTWWTLKSPPKDNSGDISTSGFIEAKNVIVSSEVGGRIATMAAEEGDEIDSGEVLIQLDDSMLRAEKAKAEANLELSRVSFKNAFEVQNNPLELEGKIIAAQGEVNLIEAELQNAIDYQLVLEKQQYQVRLDTASKVLQNLLDIKNNPQEINAAVTQAQAAMNVAGKSLELIEVQISKLTISSPISGAVSERNYEVGEVVQPGAPILTVTEVSPVTLTAYVPESKIGLVKLGQKALVFVDSYPNDSFLGKVVYISPQAQFTPRNVQLKEEREKTVFAIKIRLDNLEHKLKPGMPADARILTSSGE